MDYSTRKRRDGTSHLQCVLDVSPRRRYARNRACPAIRIKISGKSIYLSVHLSSKMDESRCFRELS